MDYWIIDLEADGLLHDSTKIWCVCAKKFGEDRVHVYRDRDAFKSQFQEDKTVLIGHNLIGYDIPMLKRWYSYDHFPRHRGSMSISIIDTYLDSKWLDADRKLPEGCPSSVYNPVSGKKDIVGPHSLMAWSYRVGGHKPVIHDWLNLDVDEYIDRCIEDVKTTEKVFIAQAEEY